MMQVTRAEAKEHFDDLIEAAMRVEIVVIESGDETTLQIVAIPRQPPRRRRTFGSAKGLIKSADDFNEPLEDFREYM